jgi:hemerythrin superfamily protein
MSARVWDLLQADHDAIWELLARITGGADEPPDDRSLQRRTARQLVRMQSAHEFAEERVIMPLVRRHLEDGGEIADEVLQQECQLKRALNELYHLSAGTTEFEECVNTVAAENRNHLSYEQNQVWPRLADVLDEAELTRLARAWTVARRVAPTRPHPHVPARPWLLSSAGMVLGSRDRLADALRRSA